MYKLTCYLQFARVNILTIKLSRKNLIIENPLARIISKLNLDFQERTANINIVIFFMSIEDVC